MSRKLKLALLGTRGIPGRYGGFETFAEQLATRLVSRGHSVTVYGRKRFFEASPEGEYKGVQCRKSSTIFHKYLETPLSSITAYLDLFFLPRFDVALLCNAANSPFSFLVRLRGLPLLTNVDGIERKRAKWNSFGRAWYKLGERSAIWWSNVVIADARVIAEYYQERYGKETRTIAYGAEAVRRDAGETLAKFSLKPKQYILYVSRLEPENNALGVIEAYRIARPDLPLVIVGDAPYATEYKAKLRERAIPGVIFTGYQFAENYQELQSNCYFYIQATEVGGTHPALIEAMAYGNCIIANGTPENVEVLGGCGMHYEVNNFEQLAQCMHTLSHNPEKVSAYGTAAKARATEIYHWDVIVDQYERLFMEVVGGA